MDKNILTRIGKTLGRDLLRKAGLGRYVGDLVELTEDLITGEAQNRVEAEQKRTVSESQNVSSGAVTQYQFASKEERTYYVKVNEVGANKVKAMAIVREYKKLDMKEAKELIEQIPCVVYETDDPMQARKMVNDFQEAGIDVDEDITGTESFEFYIEHVVRPVGKQYAARGHVLNGEIRVGEQVMLPRLKEQTFQSRVLSIENAGREVSSAHAGDSIVLELADVQMHQIGIHGIIRK